jgi:predicted transcriptional regulator
MSISIPFSSETEAKLRRQAEAQGKDITTIVVQAVEEKLALAETSLTGNGAPQQRIAELRAWAASHPSLPYEADDNRESIYEGRGE